MPGPTAISASPVVSALKPWGTGFVQAVERGGDDYFQSAYKTTSATGSVRAYIGETGT